MLEHEPEQTPAVPTSPAQIPAAERRVSAEELTRAVTALEDAKAAERIAGVAPIGQVVDELGLDSTPEDIWAQVQRQRAEAAVPKPQKHSVPVLQPQIVRQARRGWRGMRGWIWVIFWCTGGFGLLAGLPHLLDHRIHATPDGDSIIISGDGQTLTTNPAGKLVEVGGDGDTVVLTGNSHWLIVNGDHNTIRVKGKIDRLTTDGDKNTVLLSAGPAPIVTGHGDGNKIEQTNPQAKI